MPKLPIDFQKCVMYKLVCNNLDVTEIYVGHTTDFIRRKQQHKSDCYNNNNTNYNFKVYEFIREHGGFENWSMILVEKFPCLDSHEACKRERFLIENLKATLNCCVPFRTQTEKEEYKKDYRAINAEKIKEQGKDYRASNADKISERQKEYHQANSAKINEHKKNYRATNNDKLKAVTNCDCGGQYSHTNKSTHFKTKLHIQYCSQIKS